MLARVCECVSVCVCISRKHRSALFWSLWLYLESRFQKVSQLAQLLQPYLETLTQLILHIWLSIEFLIRGSLFPFSVRDQELFQIAPGGNWVILSENKMFGSGIVVDVFSDLESNRWFLRLRGLHSKFLESQRSIDRPRPKINEFLLPHRRNPENKCVLTSMFSKTRLALKKKSNKQKRSPRK